MRRSSLIVLLTLVMCGCGPRLARMTDAQKSELLATERGRLLDLTDPVDKTKTHITISEIIFIGPWSRTREKYRTTGPGRVFTSALRAPTRNLPGST